MFADVINQDKEPSWWPSVTRALVDARLSTTKPYSTATENVSDFTCESLFAEIRSQGVDELRVRVEYLGRQQAKHFGAKGMNLYDFDEPTKHICHQILSEALTLLARVPSLGRSIQMLVKSVHLLRPAELEVDTSFSEPRLPFSIFISVPPCRIENDVSRVAEAIVHEAMHLQLSLMERQVLLIGQSGIAAYSPWRGEVRDASGLLHALYVFRVIFDWLGLMRAAIPLYASRRRRHIERQVRDVDWLFLQSALTPNGAALVDRLLRGLAVGTQ